MKTPPLTLLSLTACAALAAACNGTVDGGSGAGEDSLLPGPIRTAATPKNHAFLPFQSWGSGFSANSGWGTPDTPVLFGKVNADSKDDFIGFGYAGVYVGLSNGTSLGPVNFVLRQFGTEQGWSSARHVRLIGDINNDGRDDIVGFGDDGVWTALSNGSGFAPASYVQASFGYNQGWRVDQHERVLADVNGDHFKDIVGFGPAGTYVSFGDGAGGFGTPQFITLQFSAQQGWTSTLHVRTAVDLNGDGRDDLVGFGFAGVWTALSRRNPLNGGTYFTTPTYVLADFGNNQGWTIANRRFFVDMDADGHKDIVGFGTAGLYTARSNGDGTFGINSFIHAADCVTPVGRSCTVADLNGDGYGDFLAYGYNEWNQALGPAMPWESRVLYGVGAVRYATPDVDGDGMADVVAFNNSEVDVARSTTAAPAGPLTTPAVTWVDSATPTSLTFHWYNSATAETGYELQYKTDDNQVFQTPNPAPANSTSSLFTGLDSARKYCYRVRAVSHFTYSDWTAWACGTTQDANAPNTGTATIWMGEDSPPETGVVTYSYRWYPQGRSITRFTSSYTNGDRILFVKPGNSPDTCYSNPSAVVSLYSNGTMTPAEIASVSWHNPDGSIDFHACLGQVVASQNVPQNLVFNYDWQK